MKADLILKMIEEVDPQDTATINEIDALVHSYLHDTPKRKALYLRARDGSNSYTRNRAALKAIRPEGWVKIMENQTWFHTTGDVFSEVVLKKMQHPYPTTRPMQNLTEELAELHAIIQAIEYERGLKN